MNSNPMIAATCGRKMSNGFDIDYAGLPPGELECLHFVLDDLGWDGYLGFIDEGRENIHIGCAPSTRRRMGTGQSRGKRYGGSCFG